MRWRRLIIPLGLVLLLMLVFLPVGGVKVEPGSILLLELSGRYVEAAESPLFGKLLGDQRRPFVSLLSELKKAQRDDRIGGVVLRIRRLDIGWGMAQELREAIADLNAAGRPTLAYLETGGLGANLEYYVASAAGQLVISPSTSSPIIGLGMQYLFLGGLWEKLGAGIETVGSGEYKSGAETLGGKQMSKAHREMANSLLDSTFDQFVAGIAESRRLEPEKVRELVERAPVTPAELARAGLVDAVDSYDLAAARLGDGPFIEAADYAQIDPESVGWQPEARYALVYGSGTVLVGRGSTTPGGSLVLASDTVSQALLDAAEDPEIAGIIFRVDSPGGSPLASDIIWRAAERAKELGKPFIASVSNVAASGGYYVLCGADKIVAPAGSLVGSIGVYVMRPVIGGLLERLGIGFETLTRGQHANLLLSAEPLDQKGRDRLLTEILALYDLFVSRVSGGRGLTAEEVDEVGRGRVWTGAQAKELGLIDEVGGLRTAVRLANEATGLAPDADVSLVLFPKQRSLADQISDALQTSVARAAAPLRLPGLPESLETLIESLPSGSPLFVPPLIMEIH